MYSNQTFETQAGLSMTHALIKDILQVHIIVLLTKNDITTPCLLLIVQKLFYSVCM